MVKDRKDRGWLISLYVSGKQKLQVGPYDDSTRRELAEVMKQAADKLCNGELTLAELYSFRDQKAKAEHIPKAKKPSAVLRRPAAAVCKKAAKPKKTSADDDENMDDGSGPGTSDLESGDEDDDED